VQITSSGDIRATGTGSAAIRAEGYASNFVVNRGILLGGLCACSGTVFT
jgi:hypothetical protein